jgi:dipeptidase E
MKKLLLTSAFVDVIGEFEKILPRPTAELKVVFVPTAADLSDDPWYMRADRKTLVEMGFKVIDLSLKGKTQSEIKLTLDQADIIFVGGGNTFYLLDEANKSGFTELVPSYTKKGIIYVGSSAGSYIACPTIEAAGWLHSDKNIVDLKDLTAMNLVPYILKVHYSPEKAESLKQEIKNCRYPVKILTDEQALLAIDNDYTIVGIGNEIKL